MKVSFVFVIMFWLTAIISPSAWGQTPHTVTPESGKEYNTGLKLFNEGRFAAALEQFEKAGKLDQKNNSAVFAQGLALTKLNRPKEAVERFNTVLAADPNHSKALLALPSALYQAGDIDGALSAYDRGIAKFPKTVDFYTGKAAVLIKRKKFDDAAKVLETAQSIEPKNMKITETAAYALAESGRLKDASVLAEKILSANPNSARAHVILGDNLRLGRKYPEALTHYRAAAKNLETKAYAEHFIEVIRKQQEDDDIEREYEARQKKAK